MIGHVPDRRRDVRTHLAACDSYDWLRALGWRPSTPWICTEVAQVLILVSVVYYMMKGLFDNTLYAASVVSSVLLLFSRGKSFCARTVNVKEGGLGRGSRKPSAAHIGSIEHT